MRRALMAFMCLTLLSPGAFASKKDKKFEEEQVRLDQACEVARQKKLIPERQKYIDQCVKEGKPRPEPGVGPARRQRVIRSGRR